ncbi:hypothetical protein GCM10027031_01540 [Corynebacterium atrinae]
MLVLDSPALSPGALGSGDLPARNVPQDGLLALAGMVMPASWFARLLILAGAIAGVAGALWLARLAGAGVLGRCAAVTITLWNPFAVERFLQGHWSLVIAGWLLPLIAAAGLSGRMKITWLAMWAASLTPTGALFALATGLAVTRGRLRWVTGLIGFIATLPWVIPGILLISSTFGYSVEAFIPRAEGWVGTLGSLVGLGGIWNADAVPASREAGFALAGVVMFGLLLLGARQVPTPLLVLAGLGLGGACAIWLFPGLLNWAVISIPGAGLLRDGSKLVILALPAYVMAAASLRNWVAGLVMALALLQVPDAPVALKQLTPTTAPLYSEALVERAAGRDVYFVDAPAIVWLPDGRTVLNPVNKALSTVESGALVVDGVLVDAPSVRWIEARNAWDQGDMATLQYLGVGLIVDGENIHETGEGPMTIWPGAILLLSWLLIPCGVLLVRRGVRGNAHPS